MREGGRAAALLEAVVLVAFAVLLAACAQRVAAAARPADLPFLLAALCLGHALADLVTGFAHWLCDRVLDERTPLIGPLIVKGFRDHHLDPLGITRHDFLGVNGNTALPAVPLLALALALPAPAPGERLALVAWTLLASLSFSGVATNQFHAWAHAREVPRLVAWLQRQRVLLSPEAHAVHHTQGFDRAYCVTTGWWNPLLDRVGLFDKLEAWLGGATRSAPR